MAITGGDVIPVGGETGKFISLTRIRAVIFIAGGIAFLAWLLCVAGTLGDFLQTLLSWAVTFWNWYREMVSAFPQKTLFISLQTIAGLSVYLLLRRQIPSWGQARAGGIPLIGYFWIQTVFWVAIVVELPVAILLTLHGLHFSWHIAAYAILVLLIGVIYASLLFRETFNQERFRGFFAPIITLLAPGIGALNRLYTTRLLPDYLSDMLGWIISNYPKLILSPI